MSDDSDYEQAPEIKEEKGPEPETEQETETIPIVEEIDPSLPLPPPPEEDEWLPGAGQPNLNASPFPIYLFGAIPVILGVISLLLLLLCGFFGFQYFHSVQVSEDRMKSLTKWMEPYKGKVETLDGVHKIVNENKGILTDLEKQNKNLSHKVDEILQELKTQKDKGCKSCQHPWEQHGNFCYSRTLDMVSWSNCSNLCNSSNATFLITEMSKLKVILTSLAVNHTWVGLSFKEGVNQSLWKCDSFPSPDLLLPTPSEHHNNSCVCANACTLRTECCNNQFSCLCEKAISKKLREDG